MSKINVAFLDIDGVFCTPRAHLAARQRGIFSSFDPVAVQLFNVLADRLKLHIVVSSTWRKSHRPMDMETILRVGGFTAPMASDAFLDETGRPMYDPGDIDRTPNHVLNQEGRSGSRGHEIQAWLDSYGEFTDKYIIIDDDSDMLEEQMPYLIQTPHDDGFSFQNFIQVCDIFGVPLRAKRTE